MTAALLRPGRQSTALLLADAEGTALRIRTLAKVALPSLTAQGLPNRAAGTIVRGLAEEAGYQGPATLLLPAGTAALARAEADTPLGGTITQAVVEDALAEIRRQLGGPGRAVLSCRPSAYTVDGRRTDAPVGQSGKVLGIDAVAFTAGVAALSALDAAARAGGLSVGHVVAPADALAAVALPDGEGTAVCLRTDDCLAVHAEGGTVRAQARVPIGRRHLRQDLGEVLALEEDDAEQRLAAVLSGAASGQETAVVEERLAELSGLLNEAAAEAGLSPGKGPVLLGLPGSLFRPFGYAAAPPPALPEGAEDEALLAGAAMIELGVRGTRDTGFAFDARRGSVWSWLKRRF